jgi:hypothetical protein
MDPPSAAASFQVEDVRLGRIQLSSVQVGAQQRLKRTTWTPSTIRLKKSRLDPIDLKKTTRRVLAATKKGNAVWQGKRTLVDQIVTYTVTNIHQGTTNHRPAAHNKTARPTTL